MKLAIYDFDGTYMNSEVLKQVYKFWKLKKYNMHVYRKNYTKIIARYIFYKLGLFGWTKQKFRMNAMTITSDLFKTLNANELDCFLNELYIYLQDYINLDLKEQLKTDKSAGYYTILLSGNFECILEPFIAEGFDEVIGTTSRVNKVMLEKKDIKIIINEMKATTLLKKFPKADFQNSKAYADSDYDLPVLELVGEAIAYHPDAELTKIAKERGYKIWSMIEKQ